MRNLILAIGCLSLVACGGGGSTTTPSPAPPPPAATLTSIPEIQGSGNTSPLEGRDVRFTGVVTGDFQANDADTQSNLRGFYVQDVPDENIATSDAVFVFDGDAPTVDVNVGDGVEVTGTVGEFFGETQVAASKVRITGSGAIQPARIDFPRPRVTTNSDGDRIVDLEQFEGMLIRIPQTMTVASVRELDRFGEVLLSAGGRPYQFTNGNSPDTTGYEQYRDEIAAARIVLDDGNTEENPDSIRYLNAGAAPGYSIRVGDQVTDVTGNLRYSRGSGGSGTQGWRLEPTVDPEFSAANPRPGRPSVSGSLRVASFNALNFFTGIDAGEPDCGPSGQDNCRGADSAEEFDRQLSKIVSAISQMDAHIVGLIELENNAEESLRTIVDGLNVVLGAGSYAFVDSGTIGDDAIKVGFIYQPATVNLQGTFAILDSDVDPRFDDTLNRPALAQTFALKSNDARLTVIINHLKSKGSDCNEVGDPNAGDGQGNCNVTRRNAAAALAKWAASDPTSSGDSDVLILGDLNAYVEEDPLTTLKAEGFINLVETASGAEAYSFVFDGQSGALDHALVSSSLAQQVVETIVWHINADEPRVLDYNLDFGRDPALFDASSAYRSSDHDPVIVGLDLVD
jgi:predicted extracellular nuclease